MFRNVTNNDSSPRCLKGINCHDVWIRVSMVRRRQANKCARKNVSHSSTDFYSTVEFARALDVSFLTYPAARSPRGNSGDRDGTVRRVEPVVNVGKPIGVIV